MGQKPRTVAPQDPSWQAYDVNEHPALALRDHRERRLKVLDQSFPTRYYSYRYTPECVAPEDTTREPPGNARRGPQSCLPQTAASLSTVRDESKQIIMSMTSALSPSRTTRSGTPTEPSAAINLFSRCTLQPSLKQGSHRFCYG